MKFNAYFKFEFNDIESVKTVPSMFVDYRELNHNWYFYDICTCWVVVGVKYSGCDDGNITSYPENVLRVNTGKTS